MIKRNSRENNMVGVLHDYYNLMFRVGKMVDNIFM